MPEEPKDVFENDQRMAAFAQLGASFARMFLAMTDEGIPVSTARSVVASFARGCGESSFSRNSED